MTHLGEFHRIPPLGTDHDIVPGLVPEVIPILCCGICPCTLHLQLVLLLTYLERKGRFTLFSNHNGSFLRRQPRVAHFSIRLQYKWLVLKFCWFRSMSSKQSMLSSKAAVKQGSSKQSMLSGKAIQTDANMLVDQSLPTCWLKSPYTALAATYYNGFCCFAGQHNTG